MPRIGKYLVYVWLLHRWTGPNPSPIWRVIACFTPGRPVLSSTSCLSFDRRKLFRVTKVGTNWKNWSTTPLCTELILSLGQTNVVTSEPSQHTWKYYGHNREVCTNLHRMLGLEWEHLMKSNRLIRLTGLNGMKHLIKSVPAWEEIIFSHNFESIFLTMIMFCEVWRRNWNLPTEGLVNFVWSILTPPSWSDEGEFTLVRTRLSYNVHACNSIWPKTCYELQSRKFGELPRIMYRGGGRGGQMRGPHATYYGPRDREHCRLMNRTNQFKQFIFWWQYIWWDIWWLR